MADESDSGGDRGRVEDSDYRWLEPQPIFCDHFSLDYIGNGIVRFAFGEYTAPEQQPIYRIGLAMPVGDVKSLVEVLQRALAKAEADQQKNGDIEPASS